MPGLECAKVRVLNDVVRVGLVASEGERESVNVLDPWQRLDLEHLIAGDHDPLTAQGAGLFPIGRPSPAC